jgi:hypothetical protein
MRRLPLIRETVLFTKRKTEDGLIYRYIPDVPGKLAAGGRLQALAIKDSRSLDTRNWGLGPRIFVGQNFDVEWVDLKNTDSPSDDFKYRYLPGYNHGVTIPVAIVLFSSVAQGVLALTAIIFCLAFVMVQFSSAAYSPRLVLWLSRDPIIWHAMGLFTATFLYSLVALMWVDRWGTGRVPFFSGLLVILLLIASVMVISLLVQRLRSLE